MHGILQSYSTNGYALLNQNLQRTTPYFLLVALQFYQ